MLKQHTKHWHISWPAADSPVFISNHQPITYQQWRQQLDNAIGYAKQQTGDSVLLYQADSWQFSLWFCALLHLGKTVVLAPDGQPDTLALAGVHCQWQVPVAPDDVIAQPETTPALPCPLNLLLDSKAQVCFFTSGSTGQPKLIRKALWQLLREVQNLEQHFAAWLPAHCRVAATVSPQHIYGLLFRLLWPLCSNRPIVQQQIVYFEQWQQQLQHGPLILVASPSHLVRFDDLASLRPWRQHSSAIFSSGGPLADAVPARYHDELGAAPIEIFGSTETGGIAWRQRAVSTEPWQTFTGLHVTAAPDNSLLLSSPYLPEPEQPYQTQDQITLLNNSQFQLKGRLDRIVKVAEKRLALVELEQHCARCTLVSAVAALVLSPPRAQLALVVVLSAAGKQQLAALGKPALNQQLKQHLLQRFERVLLPKRFRYVDSLPSNSQGKLPQQRLEALFQHD